MEDWAIRLIDGGGYAGVFLLGLVETLILPVPSELILPMAGMRAANGPLSLAGVIAASTAGSMTGNMIWYFAARAIGFERFRAFVERHGRWIALDWHDVEKVRAQFDRHGGGIVCTGRLLPAVRTLVSIPAGLVRMKPLRFLIWSTLGTMLFAGALSGLGYFAGSQIHRIEEIVAPIASVVVAAGLGWYLWRQLTWRRRAAARAAFNAPPAARP